MLVILHKSYNILEVENKQNFFFIYFQHTCTIFLNILRKNKVYIFIKNRPSLPLDLSYCPIENLTQIIKTFTSEVGNGVKNLSFSSLSYTSGFLTTKNF